MNKSKLGSNPQIRTRLSYYLLEMDKNAIPEVTGENNQDCKELYRVLHSMDLLDKQPTDRYLNGKVDFRWNRNQLSGRVLAAADQPDLINNQLSILQNNLMAANANDNVKNYFLIQYEEQNSLRQLITEKQLVKWSKHDINDPSVVDVLVTDDNNRERFAKILFRSQSLEQIRDVLNNLKLKYQEMPMDLRWELSEDQNRTDLWLLVQTSSSIDNIIYCIIHNSSTIMMSDNKFPAVVTYMKIDGAIHQAIILKKSIQYSVVNKALIALARHGLAVGYPITPYNEDNVESINTPPIQNVEDSDNNTPPIQDVEASDNPVTQAN